MTEPSPATMTTSELFSQLRDRMRLAVVTPYLAYTVLFAQRDQLSWAERLTQPYFLFGLLALLVALLSGLHLIRSHRANVILQLVVVAGLIVGGLAHRDLPLFQQVSYLFWCAVVLPPLYLHGGAVQGAFATGSVIVVLAGAVLQGYLGTGAARPYWISGLLTMGTLSVLGFLITRFIERNLRLTERTSGQLKAARLDALTGLPGRAALEEECRKAIAHANRDRSPLCVIVADIDHFKQVNDRHGHNTGDEVLQAFAKRLRRNVGATGTVGRWGGEEFLILLPLSKVEALDLAEHLRQEVSQSPIAGLDVTASFGVASIRPPNDDLGQLFGRADERLYLAKNEGRNTVR